MRHAPERMTAHHRRLPGPVACSKATPSVLKRASLGPQATWAHSHPIMGMQWPQEHRQNKKQVDCESSRTWARQRVVDVLTTRGGRRAGSSRPRGRAERHEPEARLACVVPTLVP